MRMASCACLFSRRHIGNVNKLADLNVDRRPEARACVCLRSVRTHLGLGRETMRLSDVVILPLLDALELSPNRTEALMLRGLRQLPT